MIDAAREASGNDSSSRKRGLRCGRTRALHGKRSRRLPVVGAALLAAVVAAGITAMPAHAATVSVTAKLDSTTRALPQAFVGYNGVNITNSATEWHDPAFIA